MAFTNATNVTLLDIAKMNGADAVVGMIDETTKAHPELSVIPGRTIKGLSYKTVVRTGLPTVGFRSANSGYAAGKSNYENRQVDTFIFNPRIEADVAVADGHEDGAQAYMAIEGLGAMEASAQLLCRQIYYGRNQWTVSSVTYGGDPLGFPGLIDAYDTTYEYNAAGTTANTASSVWGVRFGEQYAQWVFGQQGEFKLSDILIQRVLDSNNNPFDAYCQTILCRPGLQIGNRRGVGRIKNLTADSGCTLTDAKLAAWIAQFEVGQEPQAILFNRRSRSQLQQSRTVVLYGNSNNKVSGKEANIAPLPSEFNGIPLICTDSILNVEAIS